MNKADLINFVAEDTGASKKDARTIINAVIAGVTEGLTTDRKVTLVGFGTFTSVDRAARTARNPKTGEPIEVPAKVVPKFKPSKNLKAVVDEKLDVAAE